MVPIEVVRGEKNLFVWNIHGTACHSSMESTSYVDVHISRMWIMKYQGVGPTEDQNELAFLRV